VRRKGRAIVDDSADGKGGEKDLNKMTGKNLLDSVPIYSCKFVRYVLKISRISGP
jgi:hypothetical protein